jgi:hypothetical protein
LFITKRCGSFEYALWHDPHPRFPSNNLILRSILPALAIPKSPPRVRSVARSWTPIGWSASNSLDIIRTECDPASFADAPS